MAFKAHSYASPVHDWLIDASGKAILQSVSITDHLYPMYDPARTTPNTDKEISWRCPCIDSRNNIAAY